MTETPPQAPQKRFHLFELLLVIAILGLLSTLAIIAIGNAREQARDAARLEDVREIQVSLELYFHDHNRYPEAVEAVTLGQGNFACLGNSGWAATGCETGYLANVPSNPTPGGVLYRYVSDGSSFKVEFALEGQVGDKMPGVHMLTQDGIDASVNQNILPAGSE